MKRRCKEPECHVYVHTLNGKPGDGWRCKEHTREECADGETYEHDRDHERLAAQRHRIKAVMLDGQRHTLAGIEGVTGDPQASISARLRDLRKEKFGSHIVDRQYEGDGLWSYKLLVNGEQGVLI